MQLESIFPVLFSVWTTVIYALIWVNAEKFYTFQMVIKEKRPKLFDILAFFKSSVENPKQWKRNFRICVSAMYVLLMVSLIVELFWFRDWQ